MPDWISKRTLLTIAMQGAISCPGLKLSSDLDCFIVVKFSAELDCFTVFCASACVEIRYAGQAMDESLHSASCYCMLYSSGFV